jgi:hypothetical protein
VTFVAFVDVLLVLVVVALVAVGEEVEVLKEVVVLVSVAVGWAIGDCPPLRRKTPAIATTAITITTMTKDPILDTIRST